MGTRFFSQSQKPEAQILILELLLVGEGKNRPWLGEPEVQRGIGPTFMVIKPVDFGVSLVQAWALLVVSCVTSARFQTLGALKTWCRAALFAQLFKADIAVVRDYIFR